MVHDGDYEIGRQDLRDQLHRTTFRLKNFKKRFPFPYDLPSGERRLTFEWVRRSGKKLSEAVEVNVPAGGLRTVVVEIGALGRAMTVRVE